MQLGIGLSLGQCCNLSGQIADIVSGLQHRLVPMNGVFADVVGLTEVTVVGSPTYDTSDGRDWLYLNGVVKYWHFFGQHPVNFTACGWWRPENLINAPRGICMEYIDASSTLKMRWANYQIAGSDMKMQGGVEGSLLTLIYLLDQTTGLSVPLHWAITHDTTEQVQRLYINGVLAAEKTGVSARTPGDKWTSRNANTGTANSAIGAHSDVRIYDRALSETDIAALYADDPWSAPTVVSGSIFEAGPYEITDSASPLTLTSADLVDGDIGWMTVNLTASRDIVVDGGLSWDVASDIAPVGDTITLTTAQDGKVIRLTNTGDVVLLEISA